MALCECGCGQTTKVSTENDPRYGWVKGEPRRFVSGHNSRGATHPMWGGGRTRTVGGYVQVYVPGRRAGRNSYAYEHVLVAERALGRRLPRRAEVHHVDEDKTNNAPSNLVVCENHAYHSLLHQRMRALQACGDASALPCASCGSYERQSEMRGRRPRHPACRSTRASRRATR